MRARGEENGRAAARAEEEWRRPGECGAMRRERRAAAPDALYLCEIEATRESGTRSRRATREEAAFMNHNRLREKCVHMVRRAAGPSDEHLCAMGCKSWRGVL